MQCKVALYPSGRIVRNVNLARKLHYIRGTRRGEGLATNRGEGTTREHPGAAVPIKFRLCEPRDGEFCCIGRARGLVPSVSLVSSRLVPSRLSAACERVVYSNPKIFRSGDIFWTYATDNRSRSRIHASGQFIPAAF